MGSGGGEITLVETTESRGGESIGSLCGRKLHRPRVDAHAVPSPCSPKSLRAAS